MVAIPIESESATNICDLYGNAPYFALLDMQTGTFKVVENKESGNGAKSAEYLKSLGVKSTIFYHMGEGVYKSCAKNDIDVFTCKKEFMSIDAIYTKFLKNDFKKLDNMNYNLYLDSGSCTCKSGCEGN
jgi:predicted Fe-Mo cluster-binding NifX family protein